MAVGGRTHLALRARAGRRRDPVRETWDITQESALTKPFAAQGRGRRPRDMSATLERIEQLVTDQLIA